MRTVIVCLALALIPGLMFGQSQSRKEKREEASKRSVEGVVTGPDDQAAEGAIVKLKDLKSLQVRSFVTKQDGRYHFSGLSINNDYEIKADFKDGQSKARTLSVFDARKKAIMDLKVEEKK